MDFKWRSSLDDDIVANCAGVFHGNDHPGDGAPFLANGDPFTQVPPYCQLSDGIHEITLQVCDIGHCVAETRTIELVNFAPALAVDFEPALNPWSELIMPQTGTVTSTPPEPTIPRATISLASLISMARGGLETSGCVPRNSPTP